MASFHSGRLRMRRSFSLSGDSALLVLKAMEANRNSNNNNVNNSNNGNNTSNGDRVFVGRRDTNGRSQSLRRHNSRAMATSDDDDLTLGSKSKFLALPPGLSYSNLTLNECVNNSCVVRLCVLGAPHVGKTAVVVRYLTDRFIWEYSGEETIYTSQLIHEEENITLEVHDCNLDINNSNEKHNLPVADGYVIVFSVTDAKSFDAAIMLIADQRAKVPDAPFLLMANKLDLDHSCTVSASSIREASEQHGVSYCLASAREDGESVRAAFNRLVRDVLGQRRRQPLEGGQGLLGVPGVQGLQQRKRRPSARIIESFNRMMGQIGLPK